MKNGYRSLLPFQAVLAVLGTLLSAYNMMVTASGNPGFWNYVSAAVYLLANVTLIIYAYSVFRVQSQRYFRPTVYAYMALLGLQIIQSGNFITGYGLGLDLTTFINVINLVSFGCAVRFLESLDNRKLSLRYIIISVVLKLCAEMLLVYIFRQQVHLYEILMALSVPMLGLTIIIAYLAKE